MFKMSMINLIHQAIKMEEQNRKVNYVLLPSTCFSHNWLATIFGSKIEKLLIARTRLSELEFI